MKVSMKVAAVFMAPLIGFCWVYALARMAMHLWELTHTIAFFAAAIMVLMQMMLVYGAGEAGFFNDKLEENKNE